MPIHSRPRRWRVLAATAVLAVGISGCANGAPSTDGTIPSVLVPPATTVAIGATILVPGSAIDAESDESQPTEVGMTVVAVTPSDASFFDGLDNAAEFAGYTPWLVTVRYDLTPTQRETLERPTAPPTHGVLDDGEYAEYLTMRPGSASEPDSLCPAADSADSACDVILVPAGAALAHVEWDGVTTNPVTGAVVDGADGPYADAPLRFELP